MPNHRKLLGIAALIAAFCLPALIASAAPADDDPSLSVVVSEIAWMGTTASYNHEWIELYNNTAAPVDLAGWTLRAADGSPSIPLAGTIPPAGHLLLERSDSAVPAVPDQEDE